MLDVRYSHLYFYQSLNRLQRGLSAIAELLVLHEETAGLHYVQFVDHLRETVVQSLMGERKNLSL